MSMLARLYAPVTAVRGWIDRVRFYQTLALYVQTHPLPPKALRRLDLTD